MLISTGSFLFSMKLKISFLQKKSSILSFDYRFFWFIIPNVELGIMGKNGCLIVKIRVDISSCFKSFDDSREMRGFNYGFLIILIGIRTIKREKEKKRILLCFKNSPSKRSSMKLLF